MLDRTKRFPAWLYAKECDYRVNWVGVPGEPETAGGFVVRATEPKGGGAVVVGGSLDGALMRGVGTG